MKKDDVRLSMKDVMTPRRRASSPVRQRKKNRKKSKPVVMGPAKTPGGIEHHKEGCQCLPCLNKRKDAQRKVPLSVRLSTGVIELLKQEAEIQNRPVSALVSEYIENGLKGTSQSA